MAGGTRTTIADILENGDAYSGTTAGTSMLPLIHEGSDIVLIVPCTAADLRPMDIVLYRSGKEYVLHRMLKRSPQGIYALGDNRDEVEAVAAEEILGVVEGLFRVDSPANVLESSWYKRYVLFRCRPWRIRLFLRSAKRHARACARRLGMARRRKALP